MTSKENIKNEKKEMIGQQVAQTQQQQQKEQLAQRDLSVQREKKEGKSDNNETDEIDIWLNKLQMGKKGAKRHKQCLEWQIDEYSTFNQLSKSKKFKNENVMRLSLDPNEEHEPLIAALIVVLEPYWEEQSQSNGL